MNLENIDPTQTDKPVLCAVELGEEERNYRRPTCTRELNHPTDVHAYHYGSIGDHYHYTSLFCYADPTQYEFGRCKVCYVLLEGDNKAEGPGLAYYCPEHIERFQDEYWARNGCYQCGHRGELVSRNFDPIGRYADLHCEKCGAYVRMWDPN